MGKNTIKLLKTERANFILNCLTYQKKKSEQLLHLLYFSIYYILAVEQQEE